MLFRSFGRPDGQAQDPHLYDVVATADGIRVSPTCFDGHVLVMELIEKLGFTTSVRSLDRRPGRADRGFMMGLAETPSKIICLSPTPGDDIQPVSPSLRSTEAQPVSNALPDVVPAIVENIARPTQVTHDTSLALSTSPADAPSPDGIIDDALLSKLIDRHVESVGLGPKRATPATRDRSYALKLLLDAVGDRPIGTLTPDDALAFARLLSVWPNRRKNYPQLTGLTAPAVAARAKREQIPAISPGTQHKHLMHVNALMNWAMRLNMITTNPFSYIDTSRYTRDAKGRHTKKKDIFSHADLAEIFDPERMAKYKEPHKFWVPLIAYHTGMRVNEISQMYVDDVRVDDYFDEDDQPRAVLAFDITPDREGQSVKTGYSVRRIPVPQKLLDLGFEQYVADVRASGAKHLFPGLPWQEGGPGKAVSVWVNKVLLRKVCGITSRRKSMHCLRHTLTTLMERNKVPESIMCSINGHSPGGTIEKRSYIANGTVLEMQRVLNTLPFPELSFALYSTEQFSRYFERAAAKERRAERSPKSPVESVPL